MQETTDRVRGAAEMLTDARREKRPLRGLPPGLRPRDMAEALAIQEACAPLRGMTPAGWKIGCTAPESQALLRTDGPFPGRVFAPLVFDSPARLPAADFPMRGVEVEFAFRLEDDLPPRDRAYTVEEAGAAVGSLHPAIEVVSCCLDGWLDFGVETIVADNGAHGALVLAPEVNDWRSRDLAVHRAALSFGDERIAEGAGAAVMGHPLTALAWLANHLSSRGMGLRAGEVVTTGTMTNFHPAPIGAEAVADFGDMGQVRVTFVD